MTKKESLEKIAQTFWGKPKRKKSKIFKVVFPIILICLIIIFVPHSLKLKPEIKILTFDMGREIIKINYNFKDRDLKREKYTLELGNFDLKGFKKLEFSCRKAKFKGEVPLKVEIENSLRERADLYITGIKNRWQFIGIDLEKFKEISDWSNIKKLSFIVEEWNVQEKEDTVYIDEIKFLR
jgi:hypothetical protein